MVVGGAGAGLQVMLVPMLEVGHPGAGSRRLNLKPAVFKITEVLGNEFERQKTDMTASGELGTDPSDAGPYCLTSP